VKDPLLSLAPSDLRALAAAVATGRLNPPYYATGVQRFLNVDIAGEVASSLQRLTNPGTSTVALARTLELLADGLASRPPVEDLIDFVTTGPDSGEAPRRDTAVVVRDLFQEAKASVIVVGYAIHQGQRVFQALADRMLQSPELHVRMYLDIHRPTGDTSAPSELVNRFADHFRCVQWPTGKPLPQVLYDPRSVEVGRQERTALHAKCVVVDGRTLFVSSANFTEAA
jgi:hypothetical protein